MKITRPLQNLIFIPCFSVLLPSINIESGSGPQTLHAFRRASRTTCDSECRTGMVRRSSTSDSSLSPDE